MSFKKTACVAALVLAGSAAHAEYTVELDWGASLMGGTDCSGSGRNEVGGVCHDVYRRALVGYRFQNGLGVELGRSTYGDYLVLSTEQMIGRVTTKATLLGLSYTVPVWQDVALVVRGGLARQHATLGPAAWGTETRASTNPYGGVALSYAPWPLLHLELGADVSRARYFENAAHRELMALYLGTQLNF